MFSLLASSAMFNAFCYSKVQRMLCWEQADRRFLTKIHARTADVVCRWHPGQRQEALGMCADLCLQHLQPEGTESWWWLLAIQSMTSHP